MKHMAKRSLAVLLALLMLMSGMSVMTSALSGGQTVRVSGASEWLSGWYYDWNGKPS